MAKDIKHEHFVLPDERSDTDREIIEHAVFACRIPALNDQIARLMFRPFFVAPEPLPFHMQALGRDWRLLILG